MFCIPRSLARQLRAVFRRTFGSSQRPPTWLRFQATKNEFTVRAATHDVALEYRYAGNVEPAEFCIPLDLLAGCEGKSDDLVGFSPAKDRHVTAHWEDKGIPQQTHGETPPKKLPDFPDAAAELTPNEPSLLTAIVNAVDCTDKESSRYALGCINLRGQSASLAATDGKQLLIQNGFRFPWQTDVLVPGNKFFSSRELPQDTPIEVGIAGVWATFGIGPWTIWLRIDKEGRFPKVDDLVRSVESCRSRFTVSPRDAAFAVDAIPRLPIESENGGPTVTIDLNGEISLRARSDKDATPTELVLAESQLNGPPMRIVCDRSLLRRALALGFQEFHVRSPDAIVQARDTNRVYAWMPFEPDAAVPAHADARRIVSTFAERPSRIKPPRDVHCSAEPAAAREQPKQEVPVAVKQIEPNSHRESPIEQAVALRAVLREVLALNNELVRTLKRQKQKSRLVQNTLQSLKQLQDVA